MGNTSVISIQLQKEMNKIKEAAAILKAAKLSEFFDTCDQNFISIFKPWSESYNLHVDQWSDKQSSGKFIDCDDNVLISNLCMPNQYSQRITQELLGINDYYIFNANFFEKLRNYIRLFEEVFPIRYKQSIFKMKENYQCVSDVDYHQVNVEFSDPDSSFRTYYDVQFYFKPIEASFKIIEETNDGYYNRHFKLSFFYNDLDSLFIQLLDYYKDDLSKILGYEIKHIDRSILDIVDIIKI